MRRVLCLVALLFCLPRGLAAKDYSAARFDVTIHAAADGSAQVTETVRMTFEGGPFTYVTRDIPLRKTDGVEVLGASMDGQVMHRGADPGQFEVRIRDSQVSVRWHFAPASDASHDFRVSYVVRGVVQETASGYLLEWQALPSEHPYAIAASRIVIEGAALEREPGVRTRRVAGTRTERTDRGWAIEARGIGSNGWIALAAPTELAAGIIPNWQRRERHQRAMAPRLIQFGVLATVMGLAIVFLVWKQYPASPVVNDEPVSGGPPAARAPAVAAAILAGGRSSNSHAPGTLFDLASRGVINVAETERGWRPRRRFTLSRTDGSAVVPHESALLDVMFKGDRTVDFSRAASRLARRGRAFRDAVNEELQRLGLTDDQRRSARRRLFIVGLSLAVLSVIAAVLVVSRDLGPWALTLPLGLDLAAVLSLVLAATRAELSDEGFRERERWRGFRRGLKQSMGAADSRASADVLQFLPYIAAMGLGIALSRYLKRQGGDAALPPWFRTLARSNGSAAFTAFIITTSASTHGGGAAGSGAAGGGGSGAG